MRYFNTEGVCRKEQHYMVRLDGRMDEIKCFYVDQGKYFAINRGRQYGKTTTLKALEEYLKEDYLVVSMDFQGISTMEYSDEGFFTNAFLSMFMETLEMNEADVKGMNSVIKLLKEAKQITIIEMFSLLSDFCKASEKPVVLMIDEVDNASNYQVFLDFLVMLREYYLEREEKATFHSVILVGMYHIKNLKLKMRSGSGHQYDSSWNIAADVNIDLSFSANQIGQMLGEYEADHQTGMDVSAVAEEIYRYTSGYPYLVSLICQILDEILPDVKNFRENGSVWSREGIAEAVKILLNERHLLFASMVELLDTYKELRGLIEEILYQGKRVPFNPDIKAVNMGCMFELLKEKDGQIEIANRIFEMRMLNMFIAEESLKSDAFRCGERDKNQFIQSGRLDMKRVLAKFVEYFHGVYEENDEKFVVSYGRKIFLLYLKPVIMGTGNYYLETQTRDAGRTDVVVDYLGEQFVIEMKIWRGNEYNERGERQLSEYLDYYHLKKGYMLSFNFNKKKEIGVKEITIGDKVIVEAVV